MISSHHLHHTPSTTHPARLSIFLEAQNSSQTVVKHVLKCSMSLTNTQGASMQREVARQEKELNSYTNIYAEATNKTQHTKRNEH